MDIAKILVFIRPGAQWSISNNSYDELEWLDESQTKPTLAEIEAAASEVATQRLLDDCKTEAKKRIAATDWAVLPDVGLANKSEFETYRAQLRALITNPVAEPTWPTEPEPVWS